MLSSPFLIAKSPSLFFIISLSIWKVFFFQWPNFFFVWYKDWITFFFIYILPPQSRQVGFWCFYLVCFYYHNIYFWYYHFLRFSCSNQNQWFKCSWNLFSISSKATVSSRESWRFINHPENNWQCKTVCVCVCDGLFSNHLIHREQNVSNK